MERGLMGAPNIAYTISTNKISAVSGYDNVSVTFSADGPYAQFECRATKVGEDWGVGVGTLLASFSTTPADTERTFEIYDDLIVNGDGEYRIGLYVQTDDGVWNDTIGLIPSGSSSMTTVDGMAFLARKGDTSG